MDASRHGYSWTVPKICCFTFKMVLFLLLPVKKIPLGNYTGTRALQPEQARFPEPGNNFSKPSETNSQQQKPKH